MAGGGGRGVERFHNMPTFEYSFKVLSVKGRIFLSAAPLVPLSFPPIFSGLSQLPGHDITDGVVVCVVSVPLVDRKVET